MHELLSPPSSFFGFDFPLCIFAPSHQFNQKQNQKSQTDLPGSRWSIASTQTWYVLYSQAPRHDVSFCSMAFLTIFILHPHHRCGQDAGVGGDVRALHFPLQHLREDGPAAALLAVPSRLLTRCASGRTLRPPCASSTQGACHHPLCLLAVR
jgi:hypothetical protein